ncbi:uncharacterized protein LOC132340743 [Haemorhous mexicanus]|uniref:uncharacterized protein LOC132340743 n=1 Tax=Haemorhous mexicanus TaxID=30427 RepID=UPI0028BEC45C|nr:uncharacterized protein LOC132340743 [Haemorhous mexicanus]
MERTGFGLAGAGRGRIWAGRGWKGQGLGWHIPGMEGAGFGLAHPQSHSLCPPRLAGDGKGRVWAGTSLGWKGQDLGWHIPGMERTGFGLLGFGLAGFGLACSWYSPCALPAWQDLDWHIPCGQELERAGFRLAHPQSHFPVPSLDGRGWRGWILGWQDFGWHVPGMEGAGFGLAGFGLAGFGLAPGRCCWVFPFGVDGSHFLPSLPLALLASLFPSCCFCFLPNIFVSFPNFLFPSQRFLFPPWCFLPGVSVSFPIFFYFLPRVFIPFPKETKFQFWFSFHSQQFPPCSAGITTNLNSWPGREFGNLFGGIWEFIWRFLSSQGGNLGINLGEFGNLFGGI